MKSFKINKSLTVVILILACLSLLAYRSMAVSEVSLKQQDQEFITKIKKHLKKQDDEVLVSDVHPGDWIKVCINPIGAYSNVLVRHVENEGLRPNGLRIINNADSYADDNVWGIYFLYPENNVEYYRIPIKEMTGWYVSEGGNDSCYPKEKASFRVIEDLSKWSGQKTSVSKDYVKINLIGKDKRND